RYSIGNRGYAVAATLLPKSCADLRHLPRGAGQGPRCGGNQAGSRRVIVPDGVSTQRRIALPMPPIVGCPHRRRCAIAQAGSGREGALMHIVGTHHIALKTANYDAMRTFYTETLGLPVVGGFPGGNIVFLSLGDTTIELINAA